MQVIYEDNHLIAVNKPAGMLVHEDKTGDPTLVDMVKGYIKDRYKKPGDVFLGVIHRVDRPVSGVVIFARTSKALGRMNKLFAERDIEKQYWALTITRPDPIEGTLQHYLIKDKPNNKVHLFDKQRYKTAKHCELSYRLLAEIGEHFLVEVNPKTGRPHQIRAQLARIGLPIRGDKKYGSTYNPRRGMIYLHSRSLEFTHPVKKTPVSITADPPDEQVWNMFDDFLE